MFFCMIYHINYKIYQKYFIIFFPRSGSKVYDDVFGPLVSENFQDDCSDEVEK